MIQGCPLYLGSGCVGGQNLLPCTFFFKQPVYKQPVLRPLKNVAAYEAQKSPVA